MVYEPEVIKHQMEETRASLADKIETLEQHVLGTVQETTSAVSDTAEKVTEAVEGTVETVKETVESVKESVMESVESVKETVKETFDLRLQTERHPWLVFGGSVALGLAAGYLAPRLLEGSKRRGNSDGRGELGYRAAEAAPAASAVPAVAGRFASWLKDAIGPEVERLKELALQRIKGGFHDMVSEAVAKFDQNVQGGGGPQGFGARHGGRQGMDEPMHSM